jgi:FdhD protein
MDEQSSHEATKFVEIVRVNGDLHSRQKDLVVKEAIYLLKMNGIAVTSLACTPTDLDRLATGFLFSWRIINSYADIRNILVKEDECTIDVETLDKSEYPVVSRIGMITSGCGSGKSPLELLRGWKVSSNLSISASSIVKMMAKFQRASALFTSTGGVHSAALCEPSVFLFFKEDIGRHNAVDKVIGECLMKGITMRDKMLLLTGRVSSEILVKAALCNIPVLVSQSAPTNLAVEAARVVGITLVGFARGERMNVYSHEERIEYG